MAAGSEYVGSPPLEGSPRALTSPKDVVVVGGSKQEILQHELPVRLAATKHYGDYVLSRSASLANEDPAISKPLGIPDLVSKGIGKGP